ncbi:MAG: hypothetical protein RBT37_07975 [Dissulfurispiraceae bacterium]|jgi:hypothetical protein|nr:hypothetical protein [Dissulfurispiraceae bacterium]
MTDITEQIRYFYYMAGVLAGQQADPLCGICRAFTNSAQSLEDSIAELESTYSGEIKNLTGDIRHLLSSARSKIAALKRSHDAIGQKKAGNCKLPEGVCFVKASKALGEKL